MTHYNLFRMAAEVMPELIMPSTPEELEQFANIVAAAERKACAAAVHNALLEMGQPYGVCKVAVDSIKERNNQ